MELVVDEDIKAVIEFMQKAVPAEKLLGVSRGVVRLSAVLWGQHSQIDVLPIRLNPPPISETQSTASVSALVQQHERDGFEEAKVC